MIFRIWLVIACIFFYAKTIGQPYVSKHGVFQVDQISGCVPFNVLVSIDTSYPCGACDVDLEGNMNYQSTNQTQTFTYTTPGTYWMRVLAGPAPVDSILITVLPNVPPQFELYTCANNEVSVKLNDSNYDEYIINYQDGSPEVTVSGTATNDHVYASAGMKTVTVRGHNTNAADNCTPAGTIVTPLLTLPAPTINLLQVLDDQSIRLEFDAQSNIQYRLSVATNNATTFQQVKTIYNKTVDTVFNVRPDDNYYCFRLSAYDPCNNVFIHSATICSPNLDLAVRNNVIDVSWVMSTNRISNYQLTRTASDGAFLTTAPNASPYADLGVECGVEYCYQLTATYTNGARSRSLPKCGTGFSTDTPSAIRNVTAKVNDNGVVLNWQTDPDFTPAEFAIEKSSSGSYAFLTSSTQNTIADDTYRPEEASCYRISYKDVCENQSPVSVDVCPIRLTGNLRSDNSVTLTWTPYEGWANGVAGYIIEKYSEDGVLLQTIPVGNVTSYIDAATDVNYQLFIYVVKANAVDIDLGQAFSNRIAIMKDPNIFHPTAFTPNGDNLNDIFTVFGQYVVGFEMQIFNRWGELLFTTDDLQGGWDGTFRGMDMPEGTYTFIAHITDRAGRTFKRSGSVLLLRKGR